MECLSPDIDYVIFRKCTSVWRMYQHKLEYCDLTYVTEGRSEYIINGTSYSLQAGDLLYLPEGSVRSGITYPDNLMHCFSINFRLKNLKGEFVNLPFPVLTHIGYHNDIISLFHSLAHTWVEKPQGGILKVEGLFLLILNRLYELVIFNADADGSDYRIKKVTRYIATHYAERIVVKDMAKMVGLNPVYFGALFKEETGLSMNRYIIRTRIRNAENLLISGEYKVDEIALNCGFTDVAHFYKHFKSILGFPPSHFIPKQEYELEVEKKNLKKSKKSEKKAKKSKKTY